MFTHTLVNVNTVNTTAQNNNKLISFTAALSDIFRFPCVNGAMYFWNGVVFVVSRCVKVSSHQEF